MTKLLKTLLFGILIGIGIGLILSEQQRNREEIAETEAFLNNPDIKAVRAAWALEKQISEVLETV